MFWSSENWAYIAHIVNEPFSFQSAVYEAYIGDKRIILSAGDRTHRRQPHITVYDTNRVQSPMRIFYKRKIDSHYYDR